MDNMTNEIFARLQNGETAEAIAKELIDALNAANEQHKEAEKAAETKSKQKIEDMTEILDLIHDFWLDYYCKTNEDIDKLEEIFKEITPEVVIESIEELGKVAFELDKGLQDIEKLFHTATIPTAGKPIKVAMAKSPEDADMIISNFLKNMGL